MSGLRKLAVSDDSDDDKPSLEAVLDHYGVRIPSKATGMTNCPLHEDATPSMSVNLDKGLWNCHSCSGAGDSYALLMLKEETNFVGARATAATLGLATGGTGGGHVELSGSAYGSRRSVPKGKRDRQGNGGYVPAWRRK